MTDNITLPRKIGEDALWALEYAEMCRGGGDWYAESATALRTALAAPPEDIEALRRDAELWKDLATDAVSGLSYIRQYYGQLAGVGWDRVFAKKAAIDAAMKEGKT